MVDSANMKTALATAAPIAKQLAAAQHQPHLRELPSVPEVENALRHEIQNDKDLAGAKTADRDTAAKISSILFELKGELPNAAPEATSIAKETRIFIKDSKDVQMASITEKSDNGRSAVMGLVVTTGALEVFKERGDLKAALGHELAHHVFKMNPELLNNPRFQPQTDQYKAEAAVVTKLNGFGIPGRKENYDTEVKADKLGVWLSKDGDAAEHAQLMMADAGGWLDLFGKERLPNSRGALITPAIAAEDDPHPSMRVRRAEISASMEDWQENEMVKQAAKERLHPEPAPPPPKKQASSPER